MDVAMTTKSVETNNQSKTQININSTIVQTDIVYTGNYEKLSQKQQIHIENSQRKQLYTNTREREI